jgi:hypothetical protein
MMALAPHSDHVNRGAHVSQANDSKWVYSICAVIPSAPPIFPIRKLIYLNFVQGVGRGSQSRNDARI